MFFSHGLVSTFSWRVDVVPLLSTSRNSWQVLPSSICMDGSDQGTCLCVQIARAGIGGTPSGYHGRLQRAGTTEHHTGQDHIHLWGRYPHADRNQVVAACQCRTIQIFSLQHWGGRWSGVDHSLRQSAATSKGVLYIRQDHCGALLTSARGGACGCAVAYPRHRDNQMPDSRRKCQRSMERGNLAFHWRVFNHQ